MDLNDLRGIAATCEQCELHKNRVMSVFSKGNPDSKVMICGMCPGPDENNIKNDSGLPFVGRAGKLLDTILNDVDLTLDDVYITNVVKCYVKPGITLKKEWTAQCIQFLMAEVALIEPRVVVALGTDAAKAILNITSTSLAALRYKFYNVLGDDIKTIVTYHPSYFLRGGGKDHPHYNRIIEDLNQVKLIIKND